MRLAAHERGEGNRMSKTMSWIRLYVEVLDDPKVGLLAPRLKWPWVEFLLVTEKSGGVLPPIAKMAYMLRRDQASIQADIDGLVAAGLIDKHKDGTLTPHNWGGRQFRDTNADRQRRFKEKNKKAVTVEVTLPVTEPVTPAVTVPDNTQVTEPVTQAGNAPRAEQRQSTEQKQTPESPSPVSSSEPSVESETRGHTGARKLAVGRAKRLSPDWEPSQRNLADAAKFGLSEDEVPTHVLGFKDWAASSPKACKLDWDATWRTWVRRVVHERNTRPAKQIHGAQADFKILPVPPKKKVVKYDTSTFDEKTWAPHLKAYKHDGVWDTEALGPDPESIGCRVPREVREANGFRRPPITVNMNNGQKPQVWPTAPPAKVVVPDINHEEFTQ